MSQAEQVASGQVPLTAAPSGKVSADELGPDRTQHVAIGLGGEEAALFARRVHLLHSILVLWLV